MNNAQLVSNLNAIKTLVDDTLALIPAATKACAPVLSLGTPSSTQQELSWVPGCDGGAEVERFVIYFKKSADNFWQIFTDQATGTGGPVVNLDSSTSYDYQCLAINSVGASDRSATVTGSTTP